MPVAPPGELLQTQIFRRQCGEPVIRIWVSIQHLVNLPWEWGLLAMTSQEVGSCERRDVDFCAFATIQGSRLLRPKTLKKMSSPPTFSLSIFAYLQDRRANVIRTRFRKATALAPNMRTKGDPGLGSCGPRRGETESSDDLDGRKNV